MHCRHEALRALVRAARNRALVRDVRAWLPVLRRQALARGCGVCEACLAHVRELYRERGEALAHFQLARRLAEKALRAADAAREEQVSLVEEYAYPEPASGWSEREWGWFQATLNALAALGGCASVYALRRALERQRVIRFEEGLEYEAFVAGLDGVSGLCVREGKVWRVRLDAEASSAAASRQMEGASPQGGGGRLSE